MRTVGLAAIVGIAALSLLIPSTPSYDPWAWLVWGREIVHLNLQTTGGPSWKPLPMIFTTVFALFGRAAPDLCGRGPQPSQSWGLRPRPKSARVGSPLPSPTSSTRPTIDTTPTWTAPGMPTTSRT